MRYIGVMETKSKTKRNPAHRPPVGGYGVPSQKITVSLPVQVVRWLQRRDERKRAGTAARKIIQAAHAQEMRRRMDRLVREGR